MNKIFTLSILLISFVLFLNFSSGPGSVASAAVAGAPGETQTCNNSSCHVGNAFDQVTTVEVLDGEGNLVESYMPDTNYDIRLSINAASGTPSAYGFQMVTLASDDTNAGEWRELADEFNVVNLLDRAYAEHAMPLTTNSMTLPWTAPAEGTGDINIFATGNAVDRTGSAAGDDANSVQVTLSEAITSSSSDLAISTAKVSIYPNPTFDNVSVKLEDKSISGSVTIFNVLGREMRNFAFDNGSFFMSMQDLETGIYIFSIMDQDGKKLTSRKVVKR